MPCGTPSIGPGPPDFTQSILFNSVHGDGYAVGGLTIQGVRAYDSNSIQWTAPDAYKGNVHDPMSQRAYMWNNNNPITYHDPSGYETGGCSINGKRPLNTVLRLRGAFAMIGVAYSIVSRGFYDSIRALRSTRAASPLATCREATHCRTNAARRCIASRDRA